jgi:hypothetical protein
LVNTASEYRNCVSDDGSFDEDGKEIIIMLTTNYTSVSHHMGTLLYNAPEILTGQAYGAVVDVYRSIN